MSLAIFAPLLAQAALPFLSPVFGDHMVLQRGKANAFWGWTTPGEGVTVSIGGRSARATADPSGKWLVRLTPPRPGGPYEVSIVGPSRAELHDVLVGDVWICSGQSNMEFGLTQAQNGQAEVARANDPSLRLFMASRQIGYEPQPTVAGQWKVCTSETVTQGGWGGFSAVGYTFGQRLRQEAKVPVGLVQVAWGGTSAEAWTSERSLRPLKDFDADLTRIEELKRMGVPVLGTYTDLWLARHDAGTSGHWERPETIVSTWNRVTLPGTLPQTKLGVQRGAIWFQKEIQLPNALPAGPATLSLGRIDETDTTWMNGVPLGVTSFDWAFRSYPVPTSALKPGRNVISVRLFNARSQVGGFLAKPEEMVLRLGDGTIVPLAGDWMAATGLGSDLLSDRPRDFEPNPTVPTVISNGMVAPLAPLAIRGAIWYQGETNAGRGHQYRRLLPALIGDWRRMFGQGDFPFYIVSLANWQARRDQPGDDSWAELREAQAMSARSVRHSGLAVTIDVGDAGDIHPKDKRTVGERLALIALAQDYGRRVPYSGPVYRSMRREGASVRLRFNHTEGGLAVRGARLGEFSVAGADHKWHWADAHIDGDSVVVSAPGVTDPVAVRYAWQSNPLATLYNGAGLPAVPFRTDDWPGVSVGNR